VQNTSSWFDNLSNVQAASLLSAGLMVMLAAAACLLLVSVRLAPTTPLPPSAPPGDGAARVGRQADRVGSALPLAQESDVARAVTLASTVNLRAEPTTSSPSLAVLRERTELELLDVDAGAEEVVWRHVRTGDGQEGWIIATAVATRAGHN
jgi:uncharacterized protein YgiM (DUF1202 family)